MSNEGVKFKFHVANEHRGLAVAVGWCFRLNSHACVSLVHHGILILATSTHPTRSGNCGHPKSNAEAPERHVVHAPKRRPATRGDVEPTAATAHAVRATVRPL